MVQNHKILKNRFFTGDTTSSVDSGMQYSNNYYFNPTASNQKIVDASNIRSFLSSEKNQKVVKSYYSFLTASSLMNSAILINPNSNDFTPTAYFKAIYYDDVKLADSFNEFYNSSILRGTNSDTSTNPNIFNTSIRNQLLPIENVKTETQDVFHNYFLWQSVGSNIAAHSPTKPPMENAVLSVFQGKRDESIETTVISTPINQNFYHINVFLNRNITQMSRIEFDVCDNVIYKLIDSNTVFSQNPSDKIKSQEYLLKTGLISEKSFDNSNIPILRKYTESPTTTTVQEITKQHLLQCFVNPNFNINENDYWSDDFINTVQFQKNEYDLLVGGNIDVVVKLLKPAQREMSVEILCLNKTTSGNEYEILSPYESLSTEGVFKLFFDVGESEKTIVIKNTQSACTTNTITGITDGGSGAVVVTGITIGTTIMQGSLTSATANDLIAISTGATPNTITVGTSVSSTVNLGTILPATTSGTTIGTSTGETIVGGIYTSVGGVIPVDTSATIGFILKKPPFFHLELSNPSLYLQTATPSNVKIVVKTCD